MVTKLIKYDFRSYLRLLLPVQLILLGVALINRIIQLFETTADSGQGVTGFFFGASGAYRAAFISSLALYFIAIGVCLVMTVVVSIIRFYQGMYSNEGYLNHTLPVKTTQHLTAKLLTSILFTLGSLLAIILSFIVITFGEMTIEVFKAAVFLFGRFIARNGVHAALYILEAILFLALWCVFIYVKLYFCVSVGQLVNRKKILLAFGVFFGIYFVKQVIGTVMVILIFVLNYNVFYDFSRWIAAHVTAATHIVLCFGVLYYAVFGTVYYLITRYIMSKKLNLT